jgi:hypothetical protein
MKVIENFETFHKVQIHPHPTNGSRIMMTESWGRYQFWTDRTVWTSLNFKPTSERILGEL